MSHQRWFHIQKENTKCLKDLTWWVVDTIKRVFLCWASERIWYGLDFLAENLLCPPSFTVSSPSKPAILPTMPHSEESVITFHCQCSYNVWKGRDLWKFPQEESFGWRQTIKENKEKHGHNIRKKIF